MKKTVLGLVIATTALIGAVSSASAADQVGLNSANSVDSGWTLSGDYVPNMVQIVGQTPEWALRLTDTSTDTLGFALRNQEISVTAGMDVTFWESQWGGTQADGLVFFVKKATDTNDAPGAIGGSLGFVGNGQVPGISGALLGVGLDTYGGFAHSGVDNSCPDVMQGNFAQSRDAITVRGPGQGLSGYCLLSPPWNTVDNGARSYVGATSRTDGARKIRVTIDSTQKTDPRVKVYYEDVLAQDIPLPQEFAGVENVKIGFAGAEGGSTNNHEVWGLASTVANPELAPATPTLASTGSDWSIEIVTASIGLMMFMVGFILLKRAK